VGAIFPRKYDPGGGKFPGKFGPAGGKFSGGGGKFPAHRDEKLLGPF
jgi:hypothetical protein